MRRWISSSLVLFFLPVVALAQAPDEKALDAIVADALKAFDAPGAALVVVHHDKVVYLKGSGVRELGKADPVTADTIFQIASCTKAFLAMLIAMLSGDGIIDWDDPVRKHVPYFRLSDPLAEQNITIRDLLCHRTGLSRHDVLWFKSPLEPEEVIRRIGHVKLTTSFRSNWEYANIPFITAGTAVSLAAKKPLPEIFRKRIFEPLGMKSASARASDFLLATNRAIGYRGASSGKSYAVTPVIYDLRGAGEISASIRDLSQWLRFQLGDGTFEGRRLVSAKQLREMHSPHMVIKMTDTLRMSYPDEVTHHLSYGLGWFVQDYKGHRLLSHGGSLPGYRTQTVLVPQAKLGLVVITNRNPSSLTEAVSRTVVDRFLDLSQKDWNAYFVAQEKKVQADKDKKNAALRTKLARDTKPSHDLSAYAGTFDNAAYGNVTISMNENALSMQWNGTNVKLQHWHYDTFRRPASADSELANDLLVFNFEPDGAVRGLRWLEQDFARPKAAKKSAKLAN